MAKKPVWFAHNDFPAVASAFLERHFPRYEIGDGTGPDRLAWNGSVWRELRPVNSNPDMWFEIHHLKIERLIYMLPQHWQMEIEPGGGRAGISIGIAFVSEIMAALKAMTYCGDDELDWGQCFQIASKGDKPLS